MIFFLLQGKFRRSASSRIYFGTRALPGERKFQLFLWVEDYDGDPTAEYGGAILIKKNWALTSAHAVTKKGTRKIRRYITLAGGSNNLLDKNMQCLRFLAQAHVFVHPDYDFHSSTWNGYGTIYSKII